MCDPICVSPGAVDHSIELDLTPVRPDRVGVDAALEAGAEVDSNGGRLSAGLRRRQLFEDRSEHRHRIDHRGVVREHRLFVRLGVRLPLRHLGGVEHLDLGAVCRRTFVERVKRRNLRLVLCHDDFLCLAQRQVPRPAILGHLEVALQAHLSLQRVRLVVDPCVKDAAVAARGVGAQLVLFLDDDDVLVATGDEFTGDRQTDDSAAADQDMRSVHGVSLEAASPSPRTGRRSQMQPNEGETAE